MPGDFISYQVLLGGESDMLMCNPRSGYNYGGYLEERLQENGFSSYDINKIKIWNSGYPKETEKGLVNCDGSSPKIRSYKMMMPTSKILAAAVVIWATLMCPHQRLQCRRAQILRSQAFSNPNGCQDNMNDFPIRVVLSSFYWPNGTFRASRMASLTASCAL